MAKRYTKWLSIIPNGHKIYPHFPFQGPPKYTRTGIFGLKLYHLATLVKISIFLLKIFIVQCFSHQNKSCDINFSNMRICSTGLDSIISFFACTYLPIAALIKSQKEQNVVFLYV
jgi:hypothetical protein